MSPEIFLRKLLASQDLLPEQERTLQTHKKEVTDFLRTEFGNTPTIKYAGSREKGTMIREKYDLDIVCYFPNSDERSLKEIRTDVSEHLRKKYLIDPKASAERITNLKSASSPDGYHIDVVPGKFIEGTKDVFLHVAYGEKERMQTNLKTHIDHIANSGCVPVIRLVKLWAHRNHIAIKTFVQELFVVRVLNGSRNKSNLKMAFLEVITGFKYDFTTLQLQDPANTNNIVSRLVSSAEKAAVARMAEEALNRVGNSDDLANWSAVFGEGSGDTRRSSSEPVTGPTLIRGTKPQGFVPRSPWSTEYDNGTR